MSDQRPVVSEWDEDEQREEIGSPSLGRFVQGLGFALWPILIMALAFFFIVVWAFTHYR